MDAVKAFNNELSALYEVKPPISKAKMNSLTRGAIKAIKFYKHVVQSVEKFIQKCKPEYKVPGLYVIDSVVRQSRHQFGSDKDVFAPRFAKNMQQTFLNLLKCPSEDKSKIIRVLNLWQKNSVFPPEVIQPLFDLADPNHPIHKEQTNGVLNISAGNSIITSTPAKTSPSTAKNTPKDQKAFTTSKPIDPLWLAQTKMETANLVNANKLLGQGSTNQMDVSFLDQLQHLQQLLLKKQESTNETSQGSSVKFDRKLLDFDYGEEEDDDVATSPKAAQAALAQQSILATASNNIESLGFLLTNPEVLRQIQALQQTMQNNATQNEMEEKMRKLQQMKQQEEEFDKHLAQTLPTLPFASECELKPSDVPKQPLLAPPPPPPPPVVPFNVPVMPPMMTQDMSQPPPGYPPTMPFGTQPPLPPLMRPPNPQMNLASMASNQPVLVTQSPRVDENNMPRRENSVEIVNCEPSGRSKSGTPDRYRSRRTRSRSPRHRRKSRSGSRSRSKSRSRSRSSSRSRSRRKRSRSRERKREDDKVNEDEREKDRERRKRGLPQIMREKLSVCSTTLWVGHLSKLVHQEELSDSFGEIGDVVSIDLISPRGCAFICMNRRQDAYKALTKLKNYKMQGKAITLAWAPGKGVKGKDWKDYWEVENGVTYIPWNKLSNITEQDLELFEEGGMVDEDTLPPWLKGKRKRPAEPTSVMTQIQGSAIPTLTDDMMQQQTAEASQMVDTSQPPPMRAPNAARSSPATPLLQPPNQMPMMPPGFTMPPGMLGMGLQMTPGLMGNVPLGVPPPNMQGLMPNMMQQMLQSVNSPFGLLPQIPMPAAPTDKPSSTGIPHNVPPLGVPPPNSEQGMPNLPMMRQPFGVPPMPLQQMPPQPMAQDQQMSMNQSEDMDVEMEDEMVMPKEQNRPQSLSDQLLAAMKHTGNDRDDRDNFRERDRNNRKDRDNRNDRERSIPDRDRDDGRGNRDRGRGRDRGGRDGNDRRNNRGSRERDTRRDRDRDNRDMRQSPMRDMMGGSGMQGIGGMPLMMNDNDSSNKKDLGPKPSLADRLRQLADGTLPLIDERNLDRDMRGPSLNRGSSMDRVDRHGPNNERMERGRAPSMEVQQPGLLPGPRRSNEGPPSLLDLPAPNKFPTDIAGKFPLPHGGGEFSGPGGAFGGPRNSDRDIRDFSQRGGPGMGDRERRDFGPRGGPMGSRGGPIDDFADPSRNLIPGRYGPMDEFDARLGGPPGSKVGPSGRPDDFEMRAGGRDNDLRPLPGRMDEFDRGLPLRGPPGPPFDFDIRRGRNLPPGELPPFDMGRGPMVPTQEEFELREEYERRREAYYMAEKFGGPGLLGPGGPRSLMGNPDFGPRGARGLGPMFHRGMRGMRAGMRSSYGLRGGPMPFDGQEGAFFRDGRRDVFDDGRGPPMPLGRGPPFGMDGPSAVGAGPQPRGPGGMPPPLMSTPILGMDPAWRNESGPEHGRHRMEEGHELEQSEDMSRMEDSMRLEKDDRRDDKKRESRRSRWGNASPSANESATDDQQQQQEFGGGPFDGEDWDNEVTPNSQPSSRQQEQSWNKETSENVERQRSFDANQERLEASSNATKHEPTTQERFEELMPQPIEPQQESFEPPPQPDEPSEERFERPPLPIEPPEERFEHQPQPIEPPQERFEPTPQTFEQPPERFEPLSHPFEPQQERYEPPPPPSEERIEPPLKPFEQPQERLEPPPQPFESSQERFEPAPWSYEAEERLETPPQTFEPPQERFDSSPQPFKHAQERFESPPQSFEPPQERFEPPPQSFEPPQERLQPPPQSFEPPQERFEPPPQSFEPPQERFEPPPQSFEPPQEQERFEPPPQSFEPPQERFEPSPQTFEPPSQSFEPPQERFEPPPQRLESLQEKFEPPPHSFEQPQERFEVSQERFERPQERYESPPRPLEPPPPPQEHFEPPMERFQSTQAEERFEPPTVPVPEPIGDATPTEAVSQSHGEEQTTEA